MTNMEQRQTTSSDDQDAMYGRHGDADTDTGVGSTGAGSTAAERLGGPSGSDDDMDARGGNAMGSGDSAMAGDARDSEVRDSEVRDSDAVDAGGRGTEMDSGSSNAAGSPAASNGHAQATLIPSDRAESYRRRWTELKGDFVDEPRRAVRGANELVGEVLDEIEELFRRQRDEIEDGLNRDDTSTEDLRLALGNYRSFFDRLLSF